MIAVPAGRVVSALRKAINFRTEKIISLVFQSCTT